MNAQFAAKSISVFDPNFKVNQASYKHENEDRTAVLGTDYGLIVGVFDGMFTNSLCYAS
jgi:hypothetical protein